MSWKSRNSILGKMFY